MTKLKNAMYGEGMIDNLTMTLNGNQLTSVNDAATAPHSTMVLNLKTTQNRLRSIFTTIMAI